MADRHTISYRDPDSVRPSDLRQAVVAGAGVRDPETGVVWLSVVRTDCELTLVDPARIVTAPTPGPITVLAEALTSLAQDLSELDDREPGALGAAQDLLAVFVDTLIPIEADLYPLVDVDPAGALATVLGCIGSAAAEFERGNVADGKVGILLADATLRHLLGFDDEQK